MSIKVELEDLTAAVDSVGSSCFLLTTSDDLSPHPANVLAALAGEELTLTAGRRSCHNASERPTVTLMWPANSEDAMTLLVDGVAQVISSARGELAIRPTSAIWHRQPE